MRLSTILVVIPVGVVAIGFAIANRHAVTLSLDPLPWAVDLPLFVVLYLGIVAGLLIGIVAEWWRERRIRRAAREARRTASALQRENAALKTAPGPAARTLPVTGNSGP